MKAFLYAYDRRNLGDDLFVVSLVNRYPRVKFTMWSDTENRAVFSDLPNLRILDANGRFQHLLSKIRPSFGARWTALPKDHSDCCIYIGGSIFQEYDTWKNIVNWWNFHGAKYPFYVLGANFGPWHTEAYRDGMANAFRNLRDICFRDRYSHELFPDVSRLAPDILFGQIFPRATEKKQILFSVIDCKDGPSGLSKFADGYERCMTDMAEDYISHGYEVVLASFCKAEGDENACKRICEALRDRGRVCRVLFYTGINRNEMLREIMTSEYIIGTRFHATVLGLAAGKRVLPVIYNDKTKNMLTDIGFSGPVIDLRTGITPVLYRELDETAAAVDPAPLAKRSEQHFAKLDELFEKK